MNGLLKKAIIFILCMTFTYSLFGVLSTNADATQDVFKLYDAERKLLEKTTEEAKKIVCEELKISRELLDEVTKNVVCYIRYEGETKYKPCYVIEVSVKDMILSSEGSYNVKFGGSKLAHEMALAFIDHYLYPDREDVQWRKDIIKNFANLCDRYLIPSKDLVVNIDLHYCSKKEAVQDLKKQGRKNNKYLYQKWLSEGKITPLEVLDRIKAGERAEDILVKTGGMKIIDEWIAENQ